MPTTKYTKAEVVEAFQNAQRADFSHAQIQSMADEAERTGASKDFGDGYNIVRIDDLYIAQVNRKWL